MLKEKYHKRQKKKIAAYHNKKHLVDGLMLDRIDDLANDVLKNKSSFHHK